MEIRPFGQCEHFPDVPQEEQYIVWHPNGDFSNDCPRVFLACYMCRVRLVATWYDLYNKFQAGETADVLECTEGHRFLTFTQYTALAGELKEITDHTEDPT